VPRIPKPTSRTRQWIRLPLLTAAILPLTGCDPIFDVGGAFFPAWIICLLAGGAATLIIREILSWLALEDHIFWRPLSYLGCFFAISTWTWLFFFST
jgi:hypothetical protein